MTALSPVHTVGNQICEAILLHQNVSVKEAEALAAEMLAKVGIPNPRATALAIPARIFGGNAAARGDRHGTGFVAPNC